MCVCVCCAYVPHARRVAVQEDQRAFVALQKERHVAIRRAVAGYEASVESLRTEVPFPCGRATARAHDDGIAACLQWHALDKRHRSLRKKARADMQATVVDHQKKVQYVAIQATTLQSPAALQLDAESARDREAVAELQAFLARATR